MSKPKTESKRESPADELKQMLKGRERDAPELEYPERTRLTEVIEDTQKLLEKRKNSG